LLQGVQCERKALGGERLKDQAFDRCIDAQGTDFLAMRAAILLGTRLGRLAATP